ncbi:hypothetical protein BIV57_02170 [Mangrovactinospora gilvigrisea]|uniref:NERD domain-containing protein n=1 Tax=Mangrovactinospora gilvigrisea TaxID=1428644 RepID=A0A1J7BKJ2_9ACTN|nr:hypothetical protein BIV57_02170 [Mangrovactinospora gilvigrisea]
MRIVPRFRRFQPLTALAALACLALLSRLWLTWPAALPRAVFALVCVGAVALPLTAAKPHLKAQTWPVMVPALAFVLPLVYLLYKAPAAQRSSLQVTLAGLLVAYAATLLCGRLAGRARQLDRLVDKDSIRHEIFNNPGAGLTGGAEQAFARMSADAIQAVADLPATRILHALLTPVDPHTAGASVYRVEHAVLRGNRLALVISRNFAPGHFAFGQFGALTWNGRHFDGGETGVRQAVAAFERVLPRSMQVRGFVMIHPADTGAYTFDPAREGEPTVGDSARVREEILRWLSGSSPVVDRRLFGALLPYLQHPG